MNFYLLENDPQTASILQNLIEADFNNTLVGTTADPQSAYEDLLQFRVDVMILAAQLGEMTGPDLINRLTKVHSHPHFIITGPVPTPPEKSAAYQAGVDFYLPTPLNVDEARHVIHLVTSQVHLTTQLNLIYELAASTNSPSRRPQATQRRQMDRVDSILRFLGIAAETGSEDIRKVIRLMVDQKITFAAVDFARDLHLTAHEKKIAYQRIRRALRVGITNLATMCTDYPENEILLEYANNLFEYQNVHIEIQRLHNQPVRHGQISIQHFFDGLLQESYHSPN